MARGEKRLPSHRIVVFHDEENKNQTEVGAMWPHSKGGGFSITIKKGLAISHFDDVRITAFTNDPDRAKGRRGGRDGDDDDRGGGRDRGSRRSGKRSDPEDD